MSKLYRESISRLSRNWLSRKPRWSSSMSFYWALRMIRRDWSRSFRKRKRWERTSRSRANSRPLRSNSFSSKSSWTSSKKSKRGKSTCMSSKCTSWSCSWCSRRLKSRSRTRRRSNSSSKNSKGRSSSKRTSKRDSTASSWSYSKCRKSKRRSSQSKSISTSRNRRWSRLSKSWTKKWPPERMTLATSLTSRTMFWARVASSHQKWPSLTDLCLTLTLKSSIRIAILLAVLTSSRLEEVWATLSVDSTPLIMAQSAVEGRMISPTTSQESRPSTPLCRTKMSSMRRMRKKRDPLWVSRTSKLTLSTKTSKF